MNLYNHHNLLFNINVDVYIIYYNLKLSNLENKIKSYL